MHLAVLVQALDADKEHSETLPPVYAPVPTLFATKQLTLVLLFQGNSRCASSSLPAVVTSDGSNQKKINYTETELNSWTRTILKEPLRLK